MRTFHLLPFSLFAAAAFAAGSPMTGCAAATGGAGGGDGQEANPSAVTVSHSGVPGSENTTNPDGTKGSAPGSTWNGTAPKGSTSVTGGTLLVAANGTTVVAADPDRDMVSVVDLTTQKVTGQIQLPSGSEPGRVVEDSAGLVHVVLRRGGGIADIDIASRSLVALRQTCAIPRGIAVSGTNLLISCMTGQLITMTADPGTRVPLSTVNVHTADGNPIVDLRDVLVSNAGVFVTTFRSANVLAVASDGSVAAPLALNTRTDTSLATFAANKVSPPYAGAEQNYDPAVAWRAVLDPAGNIVVAHQGGTDRFLEVASPEQGVTVSPTSTTTTCVSVYYGGTDCTSVTTTLPPICSPPIVIGVTSSINPTTNAVTDGPALPEGALPVDIVPTLDGKSYIVALAGNPGGAAASDGTLLPQIVSVPSVSGTGAGATPYDSDLCGLQFKGQGLNVSTGSVTAVGVDVMGQVVAQTREPATIQYFLAGNPQPIPIPLSSVSVADEGFDLFHTNTGRGITCAGCHAEGQDDGRTWNFATSFNPDGTPAVKQPRRTQTFRTGFLDTLPLHWGGEFDGMGSLISGVLVHNMGATTPTASQESALSLWMNAIPPRMHDAPDAALSASINAGRDLFQDPSTKCATCHSGLQFTNNKSEDIGFPGGLALQTPTLIDLQFRGPFLHDGSVATIKERFTDPTALSGKHGNTSQLSQTQISDLVAYLESL